MKKATNIKPMPEISETSTRILPMLDTEPDSVVAILVRVTANPIWARHNIQAVASTSLNASFGLEKSLVNIFILILLVYETEPLARSLSIWPPFVVAVPV